jgi:V/A-type H+-transporting ATPase subunit A
MDALSPADQLTLQVAKMIREDFLQQNAFMDADTYTSLEKQFKMLHAIMHYHHAVKEALDEGVDIDALTALPVLERIARSKLVPEEEMDQVDQIIGEIDEQVGAKRKEHEAEEEPEEEEEEESEAEPEPAGAPKEDA